MRNYTSLITLFLTISSCLISTINANECRPIGFKMYLATGYEEQYLMSGRNEVETLNEGYYICSEQAGDNIEAIMNPECDFDKLRADGGLAMWLNSISDSGAMTYFGGATELTSPYFNFGNVGTTILGKVIPPGKYRMVAAPAKNRTRILRMNFQVVNCAFYLPKNECLNCPIRTSNVMPILPTTCEGSQCVATSAAGLRFVLLSYGQDTYDFGMNITSPRGSTINAFYETTGYQTSDSVTGGYVDTDYIDTSCRSTGVWIKNIVYPTYIPGTYSITIQDVLKCSFLGGPPFFSTTPPANQNRFEIRVFRRERLIQTVKDTSAAAAGKVYTFTL